MPFPFNIHNQQEKTMQRDMGAEPEFQKDKTVCCTYTQEWTHSHILHTETSYGMKLACEQSTCESCA